MQDSAALKSSDNSFAFSLEQVKLKTSQFLTFGHLVFPFC